MIRVDCDICGHPHANADCAQCDCEDFYFSPSNVTLAFDAEGYCYAVGDGAYRKSLVPYADGPCVPEWGPWEPHQGWRNGTFSA